MVLLWCACLNCLYYKKIFSLEQFDSLFVLIYDIDCQLQFTNKMNNLYQGGQCNPNSLAANSNQFKRAMNTMMIGSQNPQRVMEHAMKGQNFEDEILKRQMMFKAMNQNWSQAKNQFSGQQASINEMMKMQYNEAMIQEQRRFQMMQEMEWMRAQEHIKMQGQMMQKQFENVSLAQEAQNWQNEIKMDHAHNNAEISYEEQQANILNSSSSMLDVMMNDPDPRFQNSQFLHFLKRIKNGEVKIEGKEIREVKPDEALMENNWNQAEKIHESNMASMQSTYQQAQEKQRLQTLKAQQLLEQNWQTKLQDYQKEYADHQNFEKMLEEKYMSVLKEMNLDLTDAWQSATNLQEELVHGDMRNQYTFSQNNPYIDVAFPKKLALDLINDGKNNEAILALQAHLIKNKEDGDSWRILGRILQQNDQDQKSIPCFMNCLKQNPSNLDCLLSLGVSCTNTLDEVKAMYFLKRWIMLNPKYNLQGIDNIIPDAMTEQTSYKVEEIKQINMNLIKVFDEAVKMNPNDPELVTALAILFFLKRDYQVSIDLFNRALNLDPTNYLLMNKVGATLAHLGRADQAIKYYHRALDIRPNYVRVWVNIGIAHAFKNLYDQAARFYLNALSFRPDAKHVWSYLHTCFMSLQRYDLITQISTQDPHSFKEFEVINLNELPHPEISYKITTEKHILHRQAEQWLDQFQKK